MMKFIRQILMNRLNFRQIIKCDEYLQGSLVRLYAICGAHAHTLHEKTSCENLSNSKQKPIYYFEDGLRKVYPFYYKFATFCKGRWRNKNIADAFCSEYALYPREDILNRISKGLVRVNGKITDVNYVLKKGDLISNINHRHELAVLGCPIKILFEDDNLLVVDKPPSIPVHPCGLYYYNTVLLILANEYNRSDLYINYRLDRLTSGVLSLSKSSEKAKEIHNEMGMRNIKKEYICRVEGNFPDSSILCNKPVKQFYNKIGVSLVDPSGKIAVTEFKKLSYNGKSSVVLCKPHTGRSHQIRVHLQYLGYPIINDPVYNSFAFGPFKGKGGVLEKSLSQLMDDLLKEQSSEWCIKNDPNGRTKKLTQRENNLYFSFFQKYYHIDNKLSSSTKDCSRIIKDENCYFCKTPTQDPEQNSLGMFLHAYKYETDKWKFESDMPLWASESWDLA